MPIEPQGVPVSNPRPPDGMLLPTPSFRKQSRQNLLNVGAKRRCGQRPSYGRSPSFKIEPDCQDTHRSRAGTLALTMNRSRFNHPPSIKL
jgi:hypothetical protein